jgi:hypothetical protein
MKIRVRFSLPYESLSSTSSYVLLGSGGSFIQRDSDFRQRERVSKKCFGKVPQASESHN